jgi:hypothetical protein
MFVSSEKFTEAHSGKLGDISIYGQESNYTTWRLAKMNLAIRGIDAQSSSTLTRIATLENDPAPVAEVDSRMRATSASVGQAASVIRGTLASWHQSKANGGQAVQSGSVQSQGGSPVTRARVSYLREGLIAQTSTLPTLARWPACGSRRAPGQGHGGAWERLTDGGTTSPLLPLRRITAHSPSPSEASEVLY